MAHAEKCPICGGSGKITASLTSTDAEPVVCHGCMGRGWVTVSGFKEPVIPEPEPKHPLVTWYEIGSWG